MDVNIDTPIYNDFEKSKLKKRLRDDFKEKVNLKTPMRPKPIKNQKRKKCR